ncbi:6859_t:CDS:2, partial [Cetraspora pellucida]
MVEGIRSMREKQNDYYLALVCCREGSFHHLILDQFSQDVHSTNDLNAEAMKTIYRDLCSNVICVSSDLSGQGKTEWIKQVNCKLQQFESLHVNIISADNSNEINMFSFELLTLGFVYSNVDIVSLPQTTVFIGIASTVQQNLLNSLLITGYFNTYDRHEIDTKDVFHGQDGIKKPLPDKRCQNLIAKYFFEGNAEGVSSFRFVEVFVNVLADQLTHLSSRVYFSVENLKLIIKNETRLRTTLVDRLIDVSKEFATRLVKAKEAQLQSTSAYDDDTKFEIVKWDVSNHLLVFFMSQNPDSICALYREKNKVPENGKEFLRSQYIAGPSKWKLEDYNRMSPRLLLERL